MLTCNIFVPAGQMQTSPHTFLIPELPELSRGYLMDSTSVSALHTQDWLKMIRSRLDSSRHVRDV